MMIYSRQVKVKICGITRLEDAIKAVECGADAIGFVFYEPSPRYISPEIAKEIIYAIPPFIVTVGVFVNEDPSKIKEILAITGINVVQLHGDESPRQCFYWHKVIKAFKIKDKLDIEYIKQYKVSAYLLDTYDPKAVGGTGKIFNWEVVKNIKDFGPIILAGGLTPENIIDAINIVKPYAVDVSSGVEKSKGIKDHKKLELFIQRAKSIFL